MGRNPFFHAPANDEPATFTNTLADLIAGVLLFYGLFVAGLYCFGWA